MSSLIPKSDPAWELRGLTCMRAIVDRVAEAYGYGLKDLTARYGSRPISKARDEAFFNRDPSSVSDGIARYRLLIAAADRKAAA